MRLLKISLLMILLLPLLSFAETPDEVQLDSYVNDYADLLTDEEERELSSYLEDIQDSGEAEFAVLTVDNLGGYDRNSFAFDVAQGNLGDEDKNNGLLILVSEEGRQYRIEVGRGLEADLNDAKVGRIGREIMVPNFKEGNYYKGLRDSVLQAGAELDVNFSGKDVKESGSYYSESQGSNYEGWINLAIIVLFILFMVARAKGRKKGKRGGDDVFLAAMFASSMMRGGGGGLGGSGGFGGFGGGGFGGGGAGGGF
ncbi:MAG: TPM domain-containing protein [Nanobdellota archaeon]